MALEDMSRALALAIEHHQAGRLQEAQSLYRRVLSANPNHADALHMLGVLALQSGHAAAAIELFRRAIAIDPANAAYHGNLGMAYQAQGNWDGTIAEFREACRLRPDIPEAFFNLGAALEQAGRWAEAGDAYRAALQLRRNYPQALTQLGHALAEQGRLDEALAAHQEALRLSPGFVRAMNNLGQALLKKGQLDRAIQTFEQTMAAHPADGEAPYNLGTILLEQERYEPAIALFERAGGLQPQNAATHYHLGVAFLETNRLDEAIAAFRRALALMPNLGDAMWNLAWALLKKGDLTEGWAAYEARLDKNGPRRSLGPMWDGGDLGGRKILLHAEQGFGDAIHMARFVPLVAARGGRVILQCQPQLRTLFESLQGVTTLVSSDDPLPPFDLHCPLMSLPGRFGVTLDSIPAQIPYLAADPLKVEYWRKKLEPDAGKLKVALVYAGRAYPPGRSIEPGLLAPLAQTPNVRFYSLQKAPEGTSNDQTSTDPSEPPFPIVRCAPQLHDFSDTAALLMNMDLLISIDTATAHLAGALGRPAWFLLRHAPDWRWLLERPTTPWYPTIKLFRQSQRGDWSSPIAEAANEMRLFAESFPIR